MSWTVLRGISVFREDFSVFDEKRSGFYRSDSETSDCSEFMTILVVVKCVWSRLSSITFCFVPSFNKHISIFSLMEHTYSYVDSTTRPQETKGCIGGRINCMAVYSGERSRHHSPSGPFASLWEASRNLLVGQEVGCSSAQHSPAASRVLPVRDRAGRSFTYYSCNICFFTWWDSRIMLQCLHVPHTTLQIQILPQQQIHQRFIAFFNVWIAHLTVPSGKKM